MREIIIKGETLEYEIIRMKRKSMAMQFTDDARLLIKVPYKIDEKTIFNFLELKEQWIVDTFLKKKKKMLVFENGREIPYRGEMYKLCIHTNQSTGRCRYLVCLNESEKTISLLTREKEMAVEQVAARMDKWYRAQAAVVLKEVVEKYAKALNVTYEKIYIKEQRSLWGSCSTKRNLNFSWKLILLSPKLLSYVAAHEVAHLVEMNHSDKFWSVVRKLCPDYESCRKKLKEY